MEWTNKGGVPSELPTVAQAKKRILDDVPNILESKYPDDELTELVDSDLPIYNSEIVYQWSKLPSEFENELIGNVDKGTTIYNLMSFDLYDFYKDVYSKALEEIKEEKENA
jgi:hypothetical protein